MIDLLLYTCCTCRMEAEKRRQAELERQNRRALEIQRERERQLAKLTEQREAELREEERRRKEEWARRRQVELEGVKEWEMKALRALQSQHSNLENELQQLVSRTTLASKCLWYFCQYRTSRKWRLGTVSCVRALSVTN